MKNQVYIKSTIDIDGELEKEKCYALISQISTSFFPSGLGLLIINDKIKITAYDSDLFMKLFDITVLASL